MQKKLIKIDHLFNICKKYFYVSCNIGNTCNYSCSYCDKELHDSSVSWIKYDTLLKFLNNIINHSKTNNKIPIFDFSGGEITCFKYLPKLLEEIKKTGAKNSIITNGSRNFNYFKKIIPFLDQMCISFHFENTDKNEFIDKVVKTVEYSHKFQCFIHINIMIIPKYFYQCIEVGNILKKHNINVSFQPLFRSLSKDHNLKDYTQEELNIINNFKKTELKNSKKFITGVLNDKSKMPNNYFRGIMKNYYTNKTFDYCNPESYILKKRNKWEGWHCWAGLELIVLTSHGDIFRAWCCQDHLGNIYNNYILPEYPTICTTPICHCNLDIMVKKKLNLLN